MRQLKKKNFDNFDKNANFEQQSKAKIVNSKRGREAL